MSFDAPAFRTRSRVVVQEPDLLSDVEEPEHVRNPLTNRRIRVGGPTFNLLTLSWGAELEPFFVYDEEANELRVNAAFRVGTIFLAFIYDVAVERNYPFVLSPEQAMMFIRRIMGNARDEDISAIIQELDHWYGLHWLAIVIGGFNVVGDPGVVRDPADLNTEVPLAPPQILVAQRPPRSYFLQNLQADFPLTLPFVNYALNDGPGEACVDRWLDEDFSLTPQFRSPHGIMEWARRNRASVRLMDLFGTTIQQHKVLTEPWVHSLINKQAILYNGHVYPLTSGTKPILCKAPVNYYDNPHWVLSLLPAIGSILYQRNSVYYLGGPADSPNGVRRMNPQSYEQWMDPFFKAFNDCPGWYPPTMEAFKQGALALRYYHEDLIEGEDPSLYVALDMSKCYFNMFRRTVEERIEVGYPTIWDRWKPFHPLQGPVVLRTLRNCDYVMIDVEMDATVKKLRQFGFQANIMQFRMWQLFYSRGVQLPISHYLHFRLTTRLSNRKALAFLREELSSPDRQKQFSVINGLMGRVRLRDVTWIQVEPGSYDHNWYTTMYEDTLDCGASIGIVQPANCWQNMLHIHAHVIHYASYQVLAQAFSVKERVGAWPVRIVTDSLMYRNSDLCSAYDPDGSARLFGCFNDESWHVEDAQNICQFITGVRNVVVPPDISFENRTVTGPPGSGKTHLIRNNMEYDIALAFTNMVARNNDGVTLHSELGIPVGRFNPRAGGNIRAGKTYFVDEAQMLQAHMWYHMMHAYLVHGCRFIFAMDPNQVRPIGEMHCDFDMSHPFLGPTITLTTEHRHDAAMILLREKVLAERFVPQFELDHSSVPALNICSYSRKKDTRDFVNNLVVHKLGVEWGKSGRYILFSPLPNLGLVRGQFLTCENGVFVDDVGVPYPSIGDMAVDQQKSFMRWGYCFTIHSFIGRTVSEPLGVWDVELNDTFTRHTLYTAVTRVRTPDQLLFFKR